MCCVVQLLWWRLLTRNWVEWFSSLVTTLSRQSCTTSTTHWLSLVEFGIGITYLASSSHGKWYEPRAGLPHPKSTFDADEENANMELSVQEASHCSQCSPRWLRCQHTHHAKGFGDTLPTVYRVSDTLSQQRIQHCTLPTITRGEDSGICLFVFVGFMHSNVPRLGLCSRADCQWSLALSRG